MRFSTFGFFSGVLVATLAAISLTTEVAHASREAARSQVLVYRGAGACPGCAEAPAQLAANLGLETRYANVRSIQPRYLRNNLIWVQPGGDALEFERLVTPEKKEALRQFIANGGAYVGICAGAFFADTWVDDFNSVSGLGLIPGESYDFVKDEKSIVVPIQWGAGVREMFYQGGPAFRLNPSAQNQVEVLARYADGAPAAIQFRYGAGKVVLSGPHPEANPEWFAADGLPVPRRMSDDLATQMIQWAAQP